jgi:transposase
MGPVMKAKNEDCKKKEMITVEIKKEIIEKYERGIRVADIARFYNKSTSTIYTLLKKKEELKALDAARAVFTEGPSGPGPRAANFQGRHI